MKINKKHLLLSLSLFILIASVLPAIANGYPVLPPDDPPLPPPPPPPPPETQLIIEHYRYSSYLYSTVIVWQKYEVDSNKDYYFIKYTVTERYAQNDVFVEIYAMDADIKVGTAGALIDRANRYPGAGVYAGNELNIGWGGITISALMPMSFVTMRTDTNKEQQWHLYSTVVPVTRNKVDFTLSVSVPEGSGLYFSTWSYAWWYRWIFFGAIPVTSGYGANHYISTQDLWPGV